MQYREAIDNNPTMEVYRITPTTSSSVVSGSLRARLDLTNGSSTQNLGAGRSVTLSTTFNASGLASAATTTWSFAGVTGTTGAYSITVPRGYTYSVTVPAVIAMQKMFVNYIEPENQFASVTRVDSTSVIFSNSNTITQTSTPLVYGYYFKLPADSLSGKQITVRDGYSAFATTPTFMNGLLNLVSRDIRAADGTSIDTLRTHYSQSINNMVVNNGWEPFGSNYYNYPVRLSADGSTAIQDTLAVEFVNLTGTPYIESMPELVAITNAQGRVISIQTKRETPTTNVTISGGRFKLGTTTSVSTVLSTMVNRANYTPSGSVLVTPAASTTTANILYAAVPPVYTGIK
jgi:hypothetical protein